MSEHFIDSFANNVEGMSPEENFALQNVQLEALRNRVKVQTLEINRLKTKNITLQRACKHGKLCESGSVAKLKGELESLQQCFDVFSWKMEGQTLKPCGDSSSLSTLKSEPDFVDLKEEVNQLFGYVRKKLIIWEQNQIDMQMEMQLTKTLLLRLNGIVANTLSLSPPNRSQTQRSLKRKLVDKNKTTAETSKLPISTKSNKMNVTEGLDSLEAVTMQNKKPNIYDVESQLKTFHVTETKDTLSVGESTHLVGESSESTQLITVNTDVTIATLPLDLSVCQ